MEDSITSRIAALSPEKRALLQRQLQQKAGPAPEYDVAILGGGLAGLTLARQLVLAKPDIRIVVIERSTHPAPEATHKVGESTVDFTAYYMSEILQLREHLQRDQLRKGGLRFFFPAGDNSDITIRPEHGLSDYLPVRAYQVDRGRLENAIAILVQEQGVSFLDGCTVRDIDLQPQLQTLTVRQGDQDRSIRARWLIDASGRVRTLQKRLGLARDEHHNVNAAWFRIASDIDVEQWSDDPAWRERVPAGFRKMATTHMTGRGYWVWIIRLASGSTSIGIVADAAEHEFATFNRLDRALAWLHAHEPQMAGLIEAQRDQIQDFRVMKEFAHGCTRQFSEQRWAITGEAGAFADPLYSPGSDFIAFANTFITELITRDLAGEDISTRAALYSYVFATIAEQWFHIYRNQYAILGNAQVMSAKLIWDFAVYWGTYAQLAFHQKLSDLDLLGRVSPALQRLKELNQRMQAFFRTWDTLDRQEFTGTFVDYGSIPFLYELHANLLAQLDDAGIERQIARNIAFYEALAAQFAARAQERCEGELAARAALASWESDPLFVAGRHSPHAAVAAAGLEPVWAQYDACLVTA